MPSKDTIFLLDGSRKIREIEKQPYDDEDLLQELIEKHPALLAGPQIDEKDPPRWLLVHREMGVPDSESGGARWALDHLFIDQHAIPTLVEVKRATDTRIRREVVGQMLDYAANANRFWPVATLKRQAEDQAGGRMALEAKLVDLLEIPPDVDREQEIEAYWSEVEEHLRAGRVRLIFLADHIPSELRRIIEFLNEQMPRVHVVGLELVQYYRNGMRILVPRVVGQTEAAKGGKITTRSGSLKTDQSTFLAACPQDVRGFFEDFVAEAHRRELRVSWGTKGFSVGITEEAHTRRVVPLYGYPPGVSSATAPVLEAYIHEDSFSEAERESIRSSFFEAAPFTAGGKYTLRLPVTDDTLQQAGAALAVFWEFEEKLRRR